MATVTDPRDIILAPVISEVLRLDRRQCVHLSGAPRSRHGSGSR